MRLADLCRSHHVEILYSFGSRAIHARDALDRSRAALAPSDSDLDVGAKLVPGSRVDVREKSVMTVELEELFRVPRVDLVFLHEADPFLAANIVRGERLLAADAYSADEYELYILRRAGDCAPLERERLALLEQS